MWASVEAIFLSTFVLISQNRMAAVADKRADLDLQISLLAEHEITKVATLVTAIAGRMGVQTEVDEELDEIQQDVAPEAVLDEIEATDSQKNFINNRKYISWIKACSAPLSCAQYPISAV
jgi:uncharacterized membrane protein